MSSPVTISEFAEIHEIYCRALEVAEAMLARTDDTNRSNPTWLHLLHRYHDLADAASRISIGAVRARNNEPEIYAAWRDASKKP